MEKESGRKRRVMVGSIGDCVHSLGVETFAEWMEDKNIGYYAVKLGPAVPIQDVINKIREARPTIIGVSSRLGDLHVDKLIREFMDKALEHKIDPRSSGIRYSFGGLRPAANLVRAMTGQDILEDKFSPPDDRNYDLDKVAAEYAQFVQYKNFFELIVDDYVTMDELDRFAQGLPPHAIEEQLWSDDLLERIREVRERENRPILRAHIGIAAESVEPTIEDIEEVCDAHALEIVSLGPDQPSQAYLAKFIRGEEDPEKYLKGQGGVPIRTEEELIKLKEATRRGNYPTIRIYSGTDELLELAKLFEKHFNMPFPAVPIFFYNELDGRGPIAIREGFDEHMEVIRWWAEQNKPVEINDPHQWQLRNCSDDMYAFDHLICALIALMCGVKTYIMQLMFDLPPEISSRNDLAKMMASYELIEPLTRHHDFNIIKETRGGLSSFPPNLDMAKGHLAVTTHMQMYMDPDIIHVVSFPEAHHEAKAPDIIESCDIVKQVVKDFNLGDQPDVTADPKFQERKEELKVGVMYNALHLALMGGYEGKVTRKNYKIWAVSKEEAEKRSNPEEREMHFESMLLDLIDDNSYRGGVCGIVSADTLDFSLQTGLCQAPQLTVLDKRYEMVGKCRTKMVKGACRINAFNRVSVDNELQRVDMVYNRNPWFFNKDISMADDQSHISELGEELDEVVAQFRNQLDLHEFEHKKILVVDFGSTFTKVGIFDTDTEEFSLKYEPTTVDDLREGLANGLGVLDQCRKAGNWDPLSQKMEEFDVKLPCSSAKGGLKMVTVSLVKEESGFAAELAALTAGAKLLNSYEGDLNEEQARQIYEVDQPEIILIAGGVNDGGEKETQLHNARVLAEGAGKADYAKYGVPVIYAGNEDIADEIKTIFTDAGVDVRITGNVMPEVNTYNIEVVNEAIRELFQTIIIRGKGFDVVEDYMSAKFIPTPRAAFLGINLLAKGYGREKGLGNIVALDIGGCTTDFYANVLENPLYIYPGTDARRRVKRTILKTPNAPLAYRRVEGKYGLSYNAENILELPRFQNGSINAELKEYFNKRYPDFKKQGDPFDQFAVKENGQWDFKLEEMLKWINANPHVMPVTEEWNTVFAFLAREIMKIATSNNVGYVEETDTYFMQYGVNFFTHDTNLLLIGGTIYHKCIEGLEYHGKDLELIASGALYNECEGSVLRPSGQVYMDAQYLVSILGGLYGRLDPERALRMMKRFLQKMEVREELCKEKIAIV
ncbi:MAG: glutamate mutase L [Bacillota bacterium]